MQLGKYTVGMLWEHILLLQPIAFNIAAHLGVVSYSVNAVVKRALTLLLLALFSSFFSLTRFLCVTTLAVLELAL